MSEESSYVPVKKRITMVEGICQGKNHVVGDSWIVESVTPTGICIHAWDSLSSYLLHLDMNGKFWADAYDILQGLHRGEDYTA